MYASSLFMILSLLVFTGCSAGFNASHTGGKSSSMSLIPPGATEQEVFKYLPQGTESITALCALNKNSDKFTQVFCGTNVPNITSLSQLNSALGLTNNANVSCTTASGSLAKNETSVLTPRCIRFSQPGYDPNAVVVSYVRSTKTFLEVAANDPVEGMRFYLIKYELDCQSKGTCTNADFMTASAETNWKNVSIYEDKQLKNTVMDCTSCHQPGGVNTAKRLLMIETLDPWAHWFHKNRPCGKTLLADYMKAHANESYAGLSAAEMNNSDPAKLQAFVENNGFLGPQFGNNIYDSSQILYEIGLTTGQPENNSTPGTSPTWNALYNQRVAGTNRLAFGGAALPYPDCKQSDPAKLPGMVANYIGVSNGSIPKSQSMNLSEVNLSTPEALAKRFLTPSLGTKTAQQILANACVSCHNSSLDQSISRARFNAEDLSKNSAYEWSIAMARIQRANDDVGRMPPANFMNLNQTEISTLYTFFADKAVGR